MIAVWAFLQHLKLTEAFHQRRISTFVQFTKLQI
jgi:hypothetical protein